MLLASTEPGLVGREWPWTRRRRGPRTAGFNGARPRRPGVAAHRCGGRPRSPGFNGARPRRPGVARGSAWVRRSRRSGFNGARPRRPGVAGLTKTAGCSSPCFNGARPRRPGVATPLTPRSFTPSCFNGARPRRPGVAGGAGHAGQGGLHASTEPGLVGREWPGAGGRGHAQVPGASTEPGLVGREWLGGWGRWKSNPACFNGARPRRPGVAWGQMP